MPAEDKEVDSAIKEGVEFLFQNNIVKIIGENKVEKVECIKTELVKSDEGRDRPVNIEGSNYTLDMDFVIMAVGSKPDKKVLDNLGLEINKWGYIKLDENYETSQKNVFACGDLAGEKATVAWAASSGIKACESIENRLK